MSSINVNVWGKVVLELLSMIYHNENWSNCFTTYMNNNHPIRLNMLKCYIKFHIMTHYANMLINTICGLLSNFKKSSLGFEYLWLHFKKNWNVIENRYHFKLRSCYCCTFSKLIRVIKTSLIFCEWRCRFYITCSILDQIQYVGCYLISKTGQWNN